MSISSPPSAGRAVDDSGRLVELSGPQKCPEYNGDIPYLFKRNPQSAEVADGKNEEEHQHLDEVRLEWWTRRWSSAQLRSVVLRLMEIIPGHVSFGGVVPIYNT